MCIRDRSGIHTDITERKHTEQALRDREREFRELADSMPQIVWAAGPEGDFDYYNRRWYEFTGRPEGAVSYTHLRFLAVNDTSVHHYGYSRDEFLAMTIRDIRPPEDVPALLEAERQVELLPKFGVWRLRKKSGEIIQVELTKHTFTLDVYKRQ